MEGKVTAKKQRQVDFDVDNVVRSMRQTEVKLPLNSGPFGRVLIVEYPHFHYYRR